MRRKTPVLFAFLLGLMILGLRPATTLAAGIKQASATQNTIDIQWEDPYKDNTRYTTTKYELRYIEYADSSKLNSQQAITLSNSQTSYTLKNLKPGTKYYAKIAYYYTVSYSDGTTKEYGPSSMTAYSLYTLPGKVTGANQTRWWHYILKADFSWDKQDACSYEWKATKNNGKAFAKATTTSNYGSISKVSNTMTYKLKVRAILKDPDTGKTYTGDWSDTAYLFGQPMIKNAKIAGGKLTVKWDKVSGMTQYKIYVSTKKNKGYKLVKTLSSSKGSCTISKFGSASFKKNKNYYVYVVGLKKVGRNKYTSGANYTWTVKNASVSQGYK